MKSLFKNIATRSLIGATVLLGVCACTDDHFDVITNPTPGGNQSIWANIEGNDSLTDFASILKNTRVMKDEYDLNATQSFADLLAQPQTFTVWAPLNGTFSPEKYNNLLAEAAALRAAAAKAGATVPEDSVENSIAPSSTFEIPEGLSASQYLELAARREYIVANQFARNHISRFNYEGAIGRLDVRMLNAKNASYGEGLFNGVKVGDGFHSTNGSLYLLQGESPFAYNVYDLIGSDERFTTIYDILNDSTVQHKTFYPAGSTEGAMNENGEMVYVDSVFIYTNDILNSAGASITNEDSTYISLIPTNTAWDEAIQKVSGLFNYGRSYAYDWDEENGRFLQNGGNALQFSVSQVDSLKDYNTNMQIIRNMFFTPSVFTGVDVSDSAQVVNYAITADSLISTGGEVFYNANYPGISPLFEGITPIKASNGYVFPLDTYRVDPAYSFVTRDENDAYFLCCSTSGCVDKGGLYTYLNADKLNPEVEGSFSEDYYTYFGVQGNSKLTLRFRLRNIYSSRYKISVQMAPNRINKERIRLDEKGDTIVESPVFDAQLLGDDLRAIAGVSSAKNVEVDQNGVKTIVLFEDVAFPKCYVGLPDGYTSFPILEISMTLAQQRKGNCKALSIGKIIVEPVRE